MSCPLLALAPPVDRKRLRSRILELLMERSAEAYALAARLGFAVQVVREELDVLAWCGLVDALDPPEPASRDHMRWFLVGGRR